MTRIRITREIPEVGISLLTAKGYEVDVRREDFPLSKEALIADITAAPYDGVLSLLTDPIDREVMEAAPNVKIYANYATGFDNIDVAAAKELGITVTNAPAVASTEAVAEHTIALMLSLAARVVEADQFVRDGKYTGWAPMNFIGLDLFGTTLGLVGAGRIGERVAYYAKGLGMRIVYTDVQPNATLDAAGAHFETLEEVLSIADVVSLHTPLLPTTKHLINSERLALMKKTAFLINTSRGPVVDEAALTEALKAGSIAGAGLDVFEAEPQVNAELVTLQNVILTPHIASASKRARDEMAEIAARNLIEFFEGRVPPNKLQ